MSKRSFGWNKEVKSKKYWGGRAIVQPSQGLDIPWDRQNYDGEEDSEDFLRWVNKTVLPHLTSRVVDGSLGEDVVYNLMSADEKYHCMATCNNSGGYLYIGCWEPDNEAEQEEKKGA